MSQQYLWMIVVGCIAATFVWRLLGAIIVKQFDSQGDFFEWVTCVSYAMLAGLVIRMIMMPESELAVLSLAARCTAVAIAFSTYFIFKRSLLAGVLAGGVSLSAIASILT